MDFYFATGETPKEKQDRLELLHSSHFKISLSDTGYIARDMIMLLQNTSSYPTSFAEQTYKTVCTGNLRPEDTTLQVLIKSNALLEKPITIQNIFRGAIGLDTLPTDPLSFYPKDIADEVHSDISSLMVDIGKGSVDITTLPFILRCSTNTKSFDYRFAIKLQQPQQGEVTYLVYVQVKHSHLETITSTSYNEWLRLALKWYSDIKNVNPPAPLPKNRRTPVVQKVYSKIMVIVTNRVVPNAQDLSLDFSQEAPGHHLLIIHRDNLANFLSPTFAHRGLVSHISQPPTAVYRPTSTIFQSQMNHTNH
ncbi:hypothetical protein DFA_08004 [Cavenderia fasciculata]|uniref:Uncharacterized protein n=1 Tax=Cavenderia fasciculata TaxID=261658 RepID=F4Q4L4_CACFS|nr:uncharacterized protein DFA_08004 [Cavenderia fasciculata]EGG17023.1 hypothetical protein DFA_08004 [Cavenderia fasciculata]|eukprot:XP_004355507.1 hypothetical protein DFA_08004 [Cavenderia fasciculata]